jgi:peptidyl-tRNA hydrolase, PTH1 family
VFFRSKSQTNYDWIVCGLGNPDRKYVDTRHNLGFWVVDALADKWGASRSYSKCNGEMHDSKHKGQSILLAKPMTYMNGSGLCVGPLMRRNKDSKLLVVFDDVSLPLGKLRLKFGGSAGGHKGVESIIRHHGTEFCRLKLGISGAELDYLSDYVLDKFEPEERPIALEMVAKAVLKIEEIIAEGWEKAVTNGFNGDKSKADNGSKSDRKPDEHSTTENSRINVSKKSEEL